MAADRKNAYLTVYLALTMAVMLSLFLALLEGVRSNAVYLEAECVTDIGLNSILAEYHRELLNRYNLFAIDCSYGTDNPGVANTEQHLNNYLEMNLSRDDVFLDMLLYRDFLGMSLESTEVTKVSFLSDGKGAVFRRRAAEAVWDNMGLNLYQDLTEWMKTVEIHKLTERDIAAEKEELDKALKEYDGKRIKIADEIWDIVGGKKVKISEAKWDSVKTDNPTGALEEKRVKGILKQVVDKPEELSAKSIRLENLIEARSAAGVLNCGNMSLPELSDAEQLVERFFFQEYLMRYMGNYRKPSGEGVLEYQIEYLIAGKTSDTENLRSVANTLCAIREAANVSYLYSDQEKCAIAELAGFALASAMMIPEAADIMEHILLFGWAYAESLYDMKSLLAGGRVPLMKTNDTWHYGLEAALKFESGGAYGWDSGLSYEDYLRILMYLNKEDTLTMRAMNMVEADIRQTPGNSAFRIDACLDGVEACIKIQSAYGYSCEITRQKSYCTQ